MLADFFRYLVSEWAVISQAPVTIILMLILASGIVWWLVDWAYASRIKSKDAVIEMLNANAKAPRVEPNQASQAEAFHAAKENSGKANWLDMFREREALEQRVLELKARRPGISIKPALKVGMDEDDVREEEIKRKERRITELNDMIGGRNDAPTNPR